MVKNGSKETNLAIKKAKNFRLCKKCGLNIEFNNNNFFLPILGFPGLPTNVLNATVLTASGQPVQFTQGGPQKLIVTQHAGGQPRLIVPAQQVALLSNGTVSTTHGAAPGGATIGQYNYLISNYQEHIVWIWI